MAAGTVTARAGGEKDPCETYPDNRQATATALGGSALGIAWASTRDVGSHLYRNRAGIRPGNRLVQETVPAAAGAKGGMGSAKGGAKVASISVPKPNRWEVFGSLFFYSEDHDGESYRNRRKKKDDKYDLHRMMTYDKRRVVTGSTESSLEVFGGTIGTEYRFNRQWSAGIGLSAARGDLDMGSAGGSDIDSVSLVPYLSYYSADVLGSADLWAGLMYGYGMHSYETRRNTGGGIASGSPDADTHTLEFNVGLNYGDDDVVHGPYAGLRYITGAIDAYTEVGPGATYFGEQDVDSLVSILGYQISWKIRGGSGFWVPQLRAGWEHEFEDGGVSSFGIPFESRDEDIAVVGAGIGYWWDNGWNLGLDYEGRFGSNTEGHYGGVRAGKEF
jgi:uncharacterized protein YhjY with autotransporter beta-barrel domain